jgi:DNA-binding protein YbaB
MSSPIRDELAQALEKAREQQQAIGGMTEALDALTTTAASKDRAINATVSSTGKLTELKLTGTRYQSMAPAEFCDRIVQVVRSAQDKAFEKAAELVAAQLPAGLMPGLAELRAGEFDLDGMRAAAEQRMGGFKFDDFEEMKRDDR